MSIKAMEVSPGSCIRFNGKIWKMVDKTHVKPGKGGAYVQVKMKAMDGTKLEHRFSSSCNVELVIMEKKLCQFSYKEKDTIYFTDSQTYETIEITQNMVSKETMNLINTFACENMELYIEYADGEIVDVILPHAIEVIIESADPVVKGQTAASSYKNAIIKGNITIGVPPYIEAGNKIIVNPYAEKGIEFVERVK